MDVVVLASLLEVTWDVVSAPIADPDPRVDGGSTAPDEFDMTNPVVENDILRVEDTGGKLLGCSDGAPDDDDDVVDDDTTRS
jgi:hypothetical protein